MTCVKRGIPGHRRAPNGASTADPSSCDSLALAQGGARVTGPTQNPLMPVRLAWDPATDQLTATGTVGQKFFERFFQNFKADLIEQYGPGVYRQEVEGSVVAVPLSAYSKAVPAC